MTALVVTDLAKSFAGVAALDGVDLRVESGTVHALLGGNGSGKSTLVKVLAGVHAADRGSIEVGGRTYDARSLDAATARAAGLRFVHQDLGLIETLSVAENIAFSDGFPSRGAGGISWRRLHRRVAALLERYEIPATPTTPVAALAPAQRTMLAIARALGDGADSRVEDLVLVLDEPTASLPEHEVGELLDAVRRRAELGQAVVLISHHLQEVLQVADEITVLRDGRRAGTLARADATESAVIDLIAGRTVGDLRDVQAARSHPGAERLVVQGLAAGPVTGVDLVVRAGEVVGVAGLLGSGRSTLLRAVFGACPRRAGSVSVDGAPVAAGAPSVAMRRGIAFVPEDRGAEAAFATHSVQDNISAAVLRDYWRGGLRRRRQEARDTAGLLTAFAVKAPSGDAPFSTLSGGNQQKAILARWLRREPTVLLLDEPTQGVDVVARAEIYGLVRRSADAGCAVVVASSDFDELAILCDRVVVLRDGTVAGELHRPHVDVASLTAAVQAGTPPLPRPHEAAHSMAGAPA